jgi:hypothetical protein
MGRHLARANMAAMVDWVLGLLDATGLELMFGISALIGGVLFLLWLILIVVLGGIGDIAEGVLGINIDAMGADASFKALTFQGVMAFMMFFGLTGIIVLQADGPEFLAVIVGGASGAGSMYATGKVFQFFIALQAEGTVEIHDAVGSTGTVYLRIPKGGTGQVSVSQKGSLRQYDAKSTDGSLIPNEETVIIKDVVGTVLMVEPAVYSVSDEE